MPLNQKAGRFFFKINGMLMLIAALVVLGGPAMAEEALSADVASDVKADAKSAPCKGLKPYNNLDELLYQFYINLDSDCLFTMPIAELEKIWDIKILSKEHKNTATNDARDFYLKPCDPENDMFFIEAIQNDVSKKNSFKIIITMDCYSKIGTLFPDGNFPKLLPEPHKFSDYFRHFNGYITPPPVKVPGKYAMIGYVEFYWVNTDMTSMILLMGAYGSVSAVEIKNEVPPIYRDISRLDNEKEITRQDAALLG